MKTFGITILISIIVLGIIGGAGYWFIQDFGNNDSEDISKAAEEIEQRDESTEATGKTETKKAASKGSADMDETKVQIYLHQMTHQKIIADEKRGAVEMSADNIANMLKIVRANYDHYEHSDFYEEALLAWEQGDFSNAVSVHNTIWNWHKGTVGRATGLMSQEQEEQYVKSHFQ